jgi:hypothetical protein
MDFHLITGGTPKVAGKGKGKEKPRLDYLGFHRLKIFPWHLFATNILSFHYPEANHGKGGFLPSRCLTASGTSE